MTPRGTQSDEPSDTEGDVPEEYTVGISFEAEVTVSSDIAPEEITDQVFEAIESSGDIELDFAYSTTDAD